MAFLVNLQNSGINSKPIMTGLAVGFGATAIVGGCYYLKKKQHRSVLSENEAETTAKKNQWKSTSIIGTYSNSDPVDGRGDCRDKSQIFDPRTTPPVFPCLSAGNRTLLAKYLNEEIYDQLRHLKSTLGSSLDDCIQVGVDNPEGDPFSSPNPNLMSCGFVAVDAECYGLFEKLFLPIVRSRHNALIPTRWPEYPTKNSSFEVSMVEIRVHRNLASVPFASRITRFQRRLLYNTVIEMCADVIKPGVNIFLLSETKSEDDIEKLRRLNLYKDITIDNPYRLSIGQYRDPLDARAIALSQDESAAVIINSLDHLVFIGRDTGGRIEKAYDTVRRMADESDEWLQLKGYKLAFHEKFGYLTVLPEMLGCAAMVKARVSVPVASYQRADKLISEVRMVIADAGLAMLNEIDERESSGWFHWDVETMETFFKGAGGFEMESVVGYFLDALTKVRKYVEKFL